MGDPLTIAMVGGKQNGVSMVLLLALAGCPRTGPAPTELAAVVAPPDTTERTPLMGLRDLACTESMCIALVGAELRRLPNLEPVVTVDAIVDTLTATPEGWTVQGVCPGGGCAWDLTRDFAVLPGPRKVPMETPALRDGPGTLTEEATALSTWWRAHDPATSRIPFVPVLVGPDGRPIVLTRGTGGSGQVFTGGRSMPLAVPPSPASWPGWFALHPSGREAYVLAWPSGVLKAFDPVALASRWTVELGGAGTGLFLAAGGRFLVAATGPGDTDRFVDWPIRALDGDPTADTWLRAEPRPPSDAVVVVDIATRSRLARVPGKYRRFLVRPDGTLLVATDREVATIRPPLPG